MCVCVCVSTVRVFAVMFLTLVQPDPASGHENTHTHAFTQGGMWVNLQEQTGGMKLDFYPALQAAVAPQQTKAFKITHSMSGAKRYLNCVCVTDLRFQILTTSLVKK